MLSKTHERWDPPTLNERCQHVDNIRRYIDGDYRECSRGVRFDDIHAALLHNRFTYPSPTS